MNVSEPSAGNSAPRIGIVAALRWEVRPLLRQASAIRIEIPAPSSGHRTQERYEIYELTIAGHPTLLIVGGVGNENSYSAAQYLARCFPLRGLVSVGFAGGLSSGLEAGDVIAVSKVADVANKQWFPCDAALLPARCHLEGNLVAATEVVCSSEEKRALGAAWQAVAVDMESAGVARAALEAGLPFHALKCVTDSVEQGLAIDFNRCRSEDKDFSLWTVVWQGLTTFQGLGNLVRLAWNSRRAASALAAALQ